MEHVEIGKVYRHFKGNYYFVENVACDSETKERMVVYKPLYPREDGNYIWGICGKRGDAVGKNFMQEDGKNQPSAPGSGSSGTSERSSARSFWSSLEGNVSFR